MILYGLCIYLCIGIFYCHVVLVFNKQLPYFAEIDDISSLFINILLWIVPTALLIDYFLNKHPKLNPIIRYMNFLKGIKK